MNRSQFLNTIISLLEDDCFMSTGKEDVWKNCERVTASLIIILNRIPTLDEIEKEISAYCKSNNMDAKNIAKLIVKDIETATAEFKCVDDSSILDAFLDEEQEERFFICDKCGSSNTETVFADIVYTDVVCYDCGEEFSVVNSFDSHIEF